eukprot:349632-Chlamydomonas_euryale.AAC.35
MERNQLRCTCVSTTGDRGRKQMSEHCHEGSITLHWCPRHSRKVPFYRKGQGGRGTGNLEAEGLGGRSCGGGARAGSRRAGDGGEVSHLAANSETSWSRGISGHHATCPSTELKDAVFGVRGSGFGGNKGMSMYGHPGHIQGHMYILAPASGQQLRGSRCAAAARFGHAGCPNSSMHEGPAKTTQCASSHLLPERPQLPTSLNQQFASADQLLSISVAAPAHSTAICGVVARGGPHLK